MKKAIIIVLIIILIGVAAFFLIRNGEQDTYVPEDQVNENVAQEISEESIEQEPQEEQYASQNIIGNSANNQQITAYHFGNGDKEILLVGGIHGGYSWNTALLNNQLIDYFNGNPELIPEDIKLTIIPVLNPDGLGKVVDNSTNFSSSDVTASDQDKVAGRFNGNGVDLNRNFDCDWQAVGKWQNRDVDGGDNAFSEPESQAIRNYIQGANPKAVIVYYSSAGGVFASNCHNGVLDETSELTNVYSSASGYPAYKEFDFYEITGDMVNWLSKEGVPAISILLSDHQDTELSKNKAGVEAVIDYYSN